MENIFSKAIMNNCFISTVDYADLKVVWKKFQGMFGVVGDFIKYLPVFIDYHWKLLEELHDDNVMYVEIRSSLPTVRFFF